MSTSFALKKLAHRSFLLTCNKNVKINAMNFSIYVVNGGLLSENQTVIDSPTIPLKLIQKKRFHLSSVISDKVLVCPQFPESVSDGDVKWNKKVGDQVAVDEEVAEIETDKTAIPVNAPEAGVIEEIYVEDGTAVKSGDKLCKIKSN